MKENKALIFTHIPKTGGITMRLIINTEYLFKRGKTFTFWRIVDINELISLSDKKKQRIKIINGHNHFGVHNYLPMQAEYFTMLREPVKRLISAYNFANSSQPHPLRSTVNNDVSSLKQFLLSGRNIGYDNCYVRFYCGIPEIPYGGVTEEHLALAMHNLKTNYAVVGITERFNESILLFAKKFNWGIPYYIKSNKTRFPKKTAIFDDETTTLLNHYTRFDAIIYEEALKIFDQQVLDAGSGFNDEVIRFEKENKQKEFRTRLIFFLVHKIKFFNRRYLKIFYKRIINKAKK